MSTSKLTTAQKRKNAPSQFRVTTKVCRLCLSNTSVYFSLIDDQNVTDKLQTLTSIKILGTDEISTVMCLKCRLNLNLAYKIQQDMIKAEERFHQKLQDDMLKLRTTEIAIENVVETVTRKKPRQRVKVKTKVERFFCDQCEKSYPLKSLLTGHKYSHKKVKCTICDKELLVPNLRKHMQCHVYDPHVCEICGSTFKGPNNLKWHIRHSHSSIVHKCRYCEKSFKKNIRRVNHELKEHLNQANYVCETCGKQFYSKLNLNRHVKMKHLKLRPYICEFCKSAFSSLCAMKTHRRQHTNETPYKCDFCGIGFRQKVSLKAHLKSKHGVQEQLTQECDKCQKKFASKVALFTHQRTTH